MSKRIKRGQPQEQDVLVDVISGAGDAQDWFEKNKNLILTVLGGIVLIVGGIFAYRNMYQLPRQTEAASKMYLPEQKFNQDSFVLALDNPGQGAKGFIDINKDYSGTKAGNLAGLYTGIGYLREGDYKTAIGYLKGFSASGDLAPALKNGLLGDAYAQMAHAENNDSYYSTALGYYKSAASAASDGFTAPYYLHKLGLFYEFRGDYKAAASTFKKLSEEYPNSDEGRDAEKYIARADARAAQ